MFIMVSMMLLAASVVKVTAQDMSTQDAFSLSYSAEYNKDIPGAIKPLKAIEAKESGNYLLELRIGWLLYVSELYNESVEYYKKAAQLEPSAVEPLLGIVNSLAAGGKNEELMPVYKSILTIDPNNYTALSRLAWISYSKKEYLKAAEMYRVLVQRYPSDTEMLLGLGYALKMDGNSVDAAKYFNRVLLLSPKNARAIEGLN